MAVVSEDEAHLSCGSCRQVDVHARRFFQLSGQAVTMHLDERWLLTKEFVQRRLKTLILLCITKRCC